MAKKIRMEPNESTRTLAPTWLVSVLESHINEPDSDPSEQMPAPLPQPTPAPLGFV